MSSDSSNLAVLPSVSRARRDSPAPVTAVEDGAPFTTENITWNSGERLRLRSGLSSSTSFSNGTSWCANAPRVVSRTCLSRSRNVGLPSRFARNTSVLTKKPMRPSSSARLRPAMGEPTLTSCCPL
ncbi:hypothetical protein COSO111634_32725 [Corallococcus soli]